ncbi:MAG TPA: inositol monophosphatase family protein [Steroidobacteraceae bacterium]|nr:inositol monophosphatase family protein [Steroidobacteraceae bacterium]
MASEELKAALAAARAASEVIRNYYRKNPGVRLKSDASPVTEADVLSEEAIRATLSERFPDYGFCGEETGTQRSGAENLWLVDPIDGTKAFVREIPFFSTQIALLRAGRLVLGVSSAPVYGELAWAEAGGGAFLNDRPIRVSRVAGLADAALSTGNLKGAVGTPRWERLGQLIAAAGYSRGYGDFVHYHLLARGAIEIVIESNVNILDIAALSVIVREAGGSFTDLEGREVGLDTASVLATNGALHATVLEALKS